MKRGLGLGILVLLLTACAPRKFKGIETLHEPPPGQEVPPPVEVLSPVTEPEPLEEKLFSFQASDLPLEEILSAIADEAGLSVFYESGVDPKTPITVRFHDLTLREALDGILAQTDYLYRLEGHVLRIKTIDTWTFELGFLPEKITTSIKIGGDILGAGGGETGVSGKVEGKTESDEKILDFWKSFEANIRTLLSPDGSYVLNPFAGTLMVTDRKANLLKVKAYVERIKAALRRQVTLEVKVLEVGLRDETQFGVDWNAVFQQILGGTLTITQRLSPTIGGFEFTLEGGQGTALLKALQSQGNLRILSSPRLSIINGHTAVLSIGRIFAYWELSAQGGGAQVGTPVVFPEKKSVLIGLLMGVTPYISEEGDILLHITPVVTDIRQFEQFEWQGVTLTAPDVDVRQTSTVVRVHSGQTVVIGGLISSRIARTERKIPLLSAIPLLGRLFTGLEEKEERTELVILLTPRISKGS